MAVGSQNALLPLLAAMLICLVSFCPYVCSLHTSALHNASETDRQALMCLKSHLSHSVAALDSWKNDSLAFCDWYGVTCSKRQTARVVALDLESLNITGQIFPCIAGLRFLNRIHMPDNQINGHIPPDIGRLTRLRYLNLSMNSITGVIPDTISSCSRLEVISLWNNSIEGEIPPSLAQCSSLQEIVLSNNNLNGSIPSGIGLLPNLKIYFSQATNLRAAFLNLWEVALHCLWLSFGIIA